MERFLTTPLEEKEKFEQMKNLSARLSSNQTVIAKLEKELNDAITERDTEVKKERKKTRTKENHFVHLSLDNSREFFIDIIKRNIRTNTGKTRVNKRKFC